MAAARERDSQFPAQSAREEAKRRREDAEDHTVALPRLQRYRTGQAKLIRHEDLIQKLELDLD